MHHATSRLPADTGILALFEASEAAEPRFGRVFMRQFRSYYIVMLAVRKIVPRRGYSRWRPLSIKFCADGVVEISGSV